LFNLFIDLAARQLEAAAAAEGLPGVLAKVRLSGSRFRRPAGSSRSQRPYLRRLLYMLYADDMVVFASSAAQLTRLLNTLHSIFSSLGLQINFSKTKYMQLGHPDFNIDTHSPPLLQLAAGTISRVWQFPYLGSTLASLQPDTACDHCGSRDPHHPSQGPMVLCDVCQHGAHLGCAGLDAVPPGNWFCSSCRPTSANLKPEPPPAAHPLDPEITKRLSAAASANGRLAKIWALPHDSPEPPITLRIKLQLYNAYIINTLLYCCATWTLSELQLQRLETFHNACLRRIKRIPQGPHFCSTEELHAAGADQGGRTFSIAAWIHQFRLRFVGHLARRADDFAPTCMMYAFGLAGPEGLPARGRPGRPRKDYSDMICASFAAVLANSDDARIKQELCEADTDTWIKFAGIRGWWRNQMVRRARPVD
jgi:hypothetical protein